MPTKTLDLDPAHAAADIGAYWAGAEAAHTARRDLAAHLVDRLSGKEAPRYDVAVREIPARSLLTMIRRVHEDEMVATGSELFIHRLRGGGVPRLDGIAGAPFWIYHGEVSADSDGPVEWCWPVPGEQAGDLAARFPDLSLRTEAAHDEAFLCPDGRWEGAFETLAGFVRQDGREPIGGLRHVLVFRSPDPPDSQLAVVLPPF